MFKKILFATTGTPSCDAAARVAFDMAKRYDSQLETLHVFGVPPRSFSQKVTDIRTGKEVDLHDDSLQQVKDELQNTYATQIENYKPCEMNVMAGIPHTEILRWARKNYIELIIMGARTTTEDKTALQRYIVGRTLQGVARAARCPVLVIGREAASFWGGFSSIVFATDFSMASDSAFLFAYKLAKRFGCSLHLFHAIAIDSDLDGEPKTQEMIEDRIRDARTQIRKKYLEKMAGFKDYEIDVWEGTPFVEIVKFAREKFSDLIVMAHHTKKMASEKAVLGSTMEQVVLRSNCPVVSVNHPDKIGAL